MSLATRFFLPVTIVVVFGAAVILQQREISRLEGELAAVRTSSTDAPRAAANGQVVIDISTPERMTAAFKALDPKGKSRYQASRDEILFIESLKPGEFRGVLDAYHKSRGTSWSLKARLISAWADYDPEAALAWVTENADEPADPLYEEVLVGWGAKDMAAALAAVSRVQSAEIRRDTYSALLLQMADTDPRGALDALRKLPPNELIGDESYRDIFYKWGRIDPEAAAAAALALPPSDMRDAALKIAGQMLADKDPQAALAWADGLSGEAKNDVTVSAMRSLSFKDLDAAKKHFDNLPPGPLRNDSIGIVAEAMANKDPAAALAWVDGVSSGQIHDQAVVSVLYGLGDSDPVKAAALLSNITDASVRDKMLPVLARYFTRGDVQSALAWVQSLPASDGDARLSAFNTVMSGVIQNDPASAAAYIASIPDDPNYKRLANQVAGQWAAVDPKAALTWAESLPNGTGKDNAVGAAVSTIARFDPQAAWNYALTMPPGSGTVQTQANILATWSSQDPAAAAALLAQLPADTIRDDQPTGTIRDAATMNVVNNWLKQDPLAASKWINEMPAGGTRDNAVVALIGAEGKNDLPTAFAWATSIGGADTRNKQMETVVTQWAKKDPAAATQAVQATPMDDAQRAALLDYIRKESLR